LISQIDLLRLQVSAAQTAWKEAKEQASQAKRRRKLAKLLAKRAKKDAKTAKVRLDELRDLLARAQASATTSQRPAATGKPSADQHKRATLKKRPEAARSVRKSSGTARKPAVHPPFVPLTATTEGMLSNPIAAPAPENIPGEIRAVS
jgi:hypothetical protein